jgi:hypothetical protein
MDATAARRNKVSNDRDAGVPSSREALYRTAEPVKVAAAVAGCLPAPATVSAK